MTERQAVTIIAARFKKQYYKKRSGWFVGVGWKLQPKDIHKIILKVRQLNLIDALMGNPSWTHWYRKRIKNVQKS